MIRKSLILDILHKKTVSKRCHQGEEYENISYLSPPVKSITNISVNIVSIYKQSFISSYQDGVI